MAEGVAMSALNSTSVYVVEGRRLWGDYGQVLIHGFADRDGSGHLILKRTGPFVPPLSIPWTLREDALVVSTKIKQALVNWVPNLTFRAVRFGHIVDLPWHEWNLDAPDAEFYPNGEPEDYLTKPNAPHIRQQMAAWELVLLESNWDLRPPSVEEILSEIRLPRL
jgi:hypothetical protein